MSALFISLPLGELIGTLLAVVIVVLAYLLLRDWHDGDGLLP